MGISINKIKGEKEMIDIKKMRVEAGLTQSEFASEVGCSTWSICMWETKQVYPSRSSVLAIKKWLKARRDPELTGSTSNRSKTTNIPAYVIRRVQGHEMALFKASDKINSLFWQEIDAAPQIQRNIERGIPIKAQCELALSQVSGRLDPTLVKGYFSRISNIKK